MTLIQAQRWVLALLQGSGDFAALPPSELTIYRRECPEWGANMGWFKPLDPVERRSWLASLLLASSATDKQLELGIAGSPYVVGRDAAQAFGLVANGDVSARTVVQKPLKKRPPSELKNVDWCEAVLAKAEELGYKSNESMGYQSKKYMDKLIKALPRENGELRCESHLRKAIAAAKKHRAVTARSLKQASPARSVFDVGSPPSAGGSAPRKAA